MKAVLPWPVVVDEGGPEVTDTEVGLSWVPKQALSVVVAHRVDKAVEVVHHTLLGVVEQWLLATYEEVECSPHSEAVPGRGGGSAVS